MTPLRSLLFSVCLFLMPACHRHFAVGTDATPGGQAEPSHPTATEPAAGQPSGGPQADVVVTHDTITLRKFGISFRIPERWRAKLQSRDAYLCAEAECMALTKIGSVARTRSYTDVVNSIFPWQECLLLIGGDDWRMPREDGVYLRVYVVEAQPNEIERRIYQRWFDLLLIISRAWDPFAEPTQPGGAYSGSRLDQMWSRVLIGNQWLDVDYGDLGQVDFRMRFFGKQTVVFVFMHGEMYPPELYPQLEVIDEILQSVWWSPT